MPRTKYKVIFTQIFEVDGRDEGEVEEKFDEALEDMDMDDFKLKDVFYEVAEEVEPRKRKKQVKIRAAMRDEDEDETYFEKVSKHFWG